MKIPVFLGRFQPFHIGHLSIVEKILEMYPSMILIIGSSDKSGTPENPWSYLERLSIITESIPEELLAKILIHPLPDTEDDDIWCENLKRCILPPGQGGIKGGLVPDAVLFTGNEWVRDLCARHDIQTDWIDSYDIDISGTKIREMIKRGEDVSKWAKITS